MRTCAASRGAALSSGVLAAILRTSSRVVSTRRWRLLSFFTELDAHAREVSTHHHLLDALLDAALRDGGERGDDTAIEGGVVLGEHVLEAVAGLGHDSPVSVLLHVFQRVEHLAGGRVHVLVPP